MPTIRQPAWPYYLVSASLVVFPVYEIFANSLLPIRMGDARWRFTAFGLLSASLLIVTVGIMIASWLAHFFEHRGFQIVVGAGACSLAVVLIVLLAVFALDTLQVRGGVRVEAVGAFRAASLVAALRAVVCAIAIAGLGVGSLRAGLKSRRARSSDRNPRVPAGMPPLVSGGGAATPTAGHRAL